MNVNEIMIEADMLLQKWELYSKNNRTYMKKIFDGSNRYDMMLNIDIMQKQALIYILERGVKIFEYRTENKNIVIYAILRDIIEIVSHSFIVDSYADEKGHLHFTENIKNYRKKIVDSAFMKIGEPYNEWNEKQITIWDLKKHFDAK